ncbi:MAG: acyltransferase family protein [Brevundimonas sp.]
MTATPPQAARPTERILPLEGARGIMAWWVVLGHYTHTVNFRQPILENNALAVDVFVILSGFVITLLIIRKREPYLKYIIRRAFRIFPAYLVVLLLSAALLPVFADAMTDVPFQSERNANRLGQVEAALAWFKPHLAVHLPLLQGLVPPSIQADAPFTIVGQAWSISLEWQFYIVAPLIVFLATRRWGWAALVVIVGLLAVTASFMSIGYLGAKVFQFALGIASCFGFVSEGRRRSLAFAVAALTGFGCVAMNGWLQVWPLLIWLGCMLIVMGWRRWPIAARAASVLSSPFLKWVGDRSYSVYLVHMLPIYLGVYVLNATDLSNADYAVALFGIVIVATVVLSVASYTLVERPFIKVGAWLSSKLP